MEVITGPEQMGQKMDEFYDWKAKETSSADLKPAETGRQNEVEKVPTYEQVTRALEQNLKLKPEEQSDLNKFKSEHPDGVVCYASSHLQPTIGLLDNREIYDHRFESKYNVYNKGYLEGDGHTGKAFVNEHIARVYKMSSDLITIGKFPKDGLTKLKIAWKNCDESSDPIGKFEANVNHLFSHPETQRAEAMYANLEQAKNDGIISEGKVLEILKTKL